MDNNFTKPDLLDLVQELTRVVGILDQKEGLDEVISDLKLSILHLESYQSRLVDPMVNAAKEMKVRKCFGEQIFSTPYFITLINQTC